MSLADVLGTRLKRNWAGTATPSQWTDAQGVAHATQATTARRPTITTTTSGFAAVSFSPDASFGANADFMLAAAAGTSATPRYTLVCGVIQIDPGFAYDAVNGVGIVSIGSVSQVYLFPGAGLQLRLAGWNATAFAESQADINDGDAHTFIGIWDNTAGTCRLYVDGVSQPSFSAATGSAINLSTNDVLIGAFTGGVAPFQGILADVGIAQNTTAFSAGDIAAVHAELLAHTVASGAISGSASFSLSSQGTLRGVGGLVGSTSLGLASQGTLRGVGTLSGAASVGLASSGVLFGTGILGGTSQLSLTPSGAIRGVGNLAGAAAISLTPAGVLRGIGFLSGQAMISLVASTSDGGIAFIQGNAAMSLVAAGTLVGVGRLSGSSVISLASNGALRGVGRISGSSAIVLASNGMLRGVVQISGSSSFSLTSNGALRGVGKISGSSSLSLASNGTLRGVGVLSGASVVRLNAAGTLYAVTPISGSAFFSLQAFGTLSDFVRPNLQYGKLTVKLLTRSSRAEALSSESSRAQAISPNRSTTQ